MSESDQKKIKVLYLVTRADRGGAQSHVASLCKQAQATGLQAELASGDEQGWLIDEAGRIGVPTHRIKNLKRSWNPMKNLALIFEIRSLIAAGRYDIVHLHSSNSLVAAIGARLSSPKPKIVFTLHGWSILHPGWQKSAWLKRIYKLILRILLPWTNKTIFVSSADREFGLSLKMVTNENSSVIHNGINPDTKFANREEARKALKLVGDVFAVGTIARFDYPKNLELLVEAGLRLPDAEYKILLIGDGPDKSALEKFISICDQGEKIRVIDSLNHPMSLVTGLDCFVLCSRFEGLPYALLEAGLAGVPIIATPVGGVPEIIDRGQTGRLLTPADPEELAKEIQLSRSEPEERRRQAEALRAKIMSSFTEQGMAQKIFTEYENLIRDRT